MNNVQLVGRFTKEPELRYSTGENSNAILRFNIAVQRKFKSANGEYESDFPGCIAFGKTAEFIANYFHKGDPISITGRIQTGNYTNKEGVKVYTTDVVVNDVEFVPSKGGGQNNNKTTSDGNGGNPKVDNSFMDIPDITDEIPLPFN